MSMIERKAKLKVMIPPSFTKKGYKMVSELAEIQKEEWKSDGSWNSLISLPTRLKLELLYKLNKLTYGKFQTNLRPN